MSDNKVLTPEDWIERGYKKFQSRIRPRATFGLQKRFDDEKGTRYFITVWAYDQLPPGFEWGFTPESQFISDDTTFDVACYHMNSKQWGVTSIDRVETFFERMWSLMGCDYYELGNVVTNTETTVE